MTIDPIQFKAIIMNTTQNQIKELTQNERKTLKIAISYLSSGKSLDNPNFQKLQNRLTTIVDSNPVYPKEPLHKLRSLVKGIANLLPGRVSSETLVKATTKLKIEDSSELKRRFDNWISLSSLQERCNRIEAEKLIRECITNKSPNLNLEDYPIDCLPNIFERLPHLESLSLKINYYSHDNTRPLNFTNTFPISLSKCTNLKSIKINNSNLEEIPQPLLSLKNLETLDLSSNKLKSLDGIGNFTKLKKLDVSNNQLKEIPESLSQCKELSDLSIKNNKDLKIDDFPKKILALPLVFSNNLTEGTSIDPAKFESLRNEEQFNKTLDDWISDERIVSNEAGYNAQVIAASIKKCRTDNSSELSIQEVKVSSLPDVFEYLPKLETLSINIPSMEKEPPQSIGKCTALKSLSIMHSKLKSVPPFVENLANLKTLNLENNQIRSIPESIGNLKNLEELKCKGNGIKSIPTSIGNLQDLQILDLRDNQLENLPKEIGQLKKLQDLQVMNNNILSSIPKEIGNCESLKTLQVSNCNLTEIPKEIIQCTKLEELKISNNLYLKIDDLSNQIFEKTQVTEIDASQTQTKHVLKKSKK